MAEPKRLVIAGDALHDIWIHGYRLHSQDGCDKFVEQRRVVTPGGAANAANCLKNWPCKVQLFAQDIRGCKTRYIEAGKIVFRHDREIQRDCRQARQRALEAVASADAVLLSDYDKGFLTREFVTDVVSRCPVVVVDAKREPSFYEGTILKCNSAYAEQFPEVLQRDASVITYGPISPTVARCYLPYTKSSVTCVNHVGAGDCFAAHLTMGLVYGLPLVEAADFAHEAGRIYVQHPHNTPPEVSCFST